MLDLSWTELLLIAVMAVVILGPNELPKAMRTLARFVRKARSLTGEFQRQIDDMVREADLEDVRDTARSLKSRDLGREIDKAIDPDGSVRRSLEFDDVTDPTSGRRSAAKAAPGVATPEAAKSGLRSSETVADARAENAVAGPVEGPAEGKAAMGDERGDNRTPGPGGN